MFKFQLIALLLFPLIASSGETAVVPKHKPSAYKFVVLNYRVIDGDTIDATVDLGFHITKTDRFRFLGMDAPEINHEKTRQAGQKAKQFVIKKLATAKVIEIETFKQGKFGRYLATIWLDQNYNKSLNQLLLDRNLAIPVK